MYDTLVGGWGYAAPYTVIWECPPEMTRELSDVLLRVELGNSRLMNLLLVVIKYTHGRGVTLWPINIRTFMMESGLSNRQQVARSLLALRQMNVIQALPLSDCPDLQACMRRNPDLALQLGISRRTMVYGLQTDFEKWPLRPNLTYDFEQGWR